MASTQVFGAFSLGSSPSEPAKHTYRNSFYFGLTKELFCNRDSSFLYMEVYKWERQIDLLVGGAMENLSG